MTRFLWQGHFTKSKMHFPSQKIIDFVTRKSNIIHNNLRNKIIASGLLPMKKEFNPNLRTPREQLCKEEINKLNSNGLRDHLFEEFRNDKPDIIWEVEQLAKSHGIYLEYNRAKTGEEKEWMYMIRISVTGGGPITRQQWMILDELSEKYTRDSEGHPSLRFTTRQNIQFHWVKKSQALEIVKRVAESGWSSLNG